jgi:hypothetical protein
MTKANQDFDLIKAYFDDELDPGRKRDFIERYHKDIAFQEAVDEYKLFKNTFDNLSEDSSARVEQIIAGETSEKKRTIKPFLPRRSLYIAASILVILGITFVVYFTLPGDMNPRQIAENENNLPERTLNIPLHGIDNPMGYTPSGQVTIDSIWVEIYQIKDTIPYYIFQDTLKLFLPDRLLQEPTSITVVKEGYKLVTPGGEYNLHKGFEHQRELKRNER